MLLAATAALIALAALTFPHGWSWTLRTLAAWSVGVCVFLLQAWRVMRRANAEETRRHCRCEDQSAATTATLLLFASSASIAGVCLALRESSIPGGPAKMISVGVPVIAMVLSWTLVHTLFAMHYARLFYQNDEDPDGPPSGGFNMHQEETDAPDYRDFVYIAVAVACTFGVTDTELTNKATRRAVVRHALLSFAFATLALALVVNVITNLLSSGQ